MRQSESPSPLQPGDVLLSRYRVIEQLAHGGHSRVFRLEDQKLNRPACAKVLHVLDEDTRIRDAVGQRFVQEASVLSRLGNPAVVQIYDLGHVPAASPDGAPIPFHILELVAGGPLSRWVRKHGPRRPSEVLEIVLPICRALVDLHALSLVHLDVKPQNILLTRGELGRFPKLADFGIVQPMRSALADEPSAVLMYSLPWASPEQLVGDEVDASSDIYSLALVTIHALTGRVVFRGHDPTQAYRVRKHSDELIRGALTDTGFSEELIALLQRACNFFPSDRLPSVAEFARQLTQILRAGADDQVVVAPAGEDDSAAIAVGGERASSAGVTGHRTAASLWPLSPRKPPPEIAGRSLQFVMVDASAELTLKAGPRVRVSLMPSSIERGGLYLQGLNCFVAIAGGRPSSALTLDSNGAVEFVSPRGEILSRATISFGTAGPTKTTITIGKNVVTVPNAECAWLVGMDFGAGDKCVLLYDITLPI